MINLNQILSLVQILNQQLAPATVTLIHQLLQEIKMMQSLQSGVTKDYFRNSYQENQCKRIACRITTLQKQINVQQALFFKQQQQQPMGNNGNGGNGRPGNNMLGNNRIGNLASDLSNLQLSQQQQQQASQSRLNQWKLPGGSYDKDKDDVIGYQEALTNEFSRAPGPSSKQQPQPQQAPQQFVLPNSWTNMSGATGGAEESWQQNLQAARAKEQLSSSAPQQQQLMANNYGEMVADFNSKQPMNSNPRAAFYAGKQEQQMYNWSAANKLVDAGGEPNGSFSANTWSFPANQGNAGQLPAAAAQQNANIWNNSAAAAAAANSNKPKGPPPGLAQVKDQNHGFLLIRNLNLQVSWISCIARQYLVDTQSNLHLSS